MATLEDYEACRRNWEKWRRNLLSPSRIIACSANRVQLNMLSAIYPSAEILDWTIRDWDLNRPSTVIVDLIVACNVFHYSPRPEMWFKHCFESCRQLWIQDLFARQRGPNGMEFSVTDAGDCVRYSFGGIRPINVDNHFDIAKYRNRLLAYELYDAGSLREGKAMINFVACLKGDLS